MSQQQAQTIERFEANSRWLRSALRGGEEFTFHYSAESSDFIRFNQGRVRQAGKVEQARVTLELFRDERHASQTLALSGEAEEDRRRLADALERLREVLALIPADPYMAFDAARWRSESSDLRPLPEAGDVIEQIASAASGLDLVGIYAGGPLLRGFANSCGAFGWHAASSSNFDWSLFDATGQAVKSTLAGPGWDAAAFASRMRQARRQLDYLGRPPRQLAPGDYRTYLAPEALEELLSLLSWGGFSARALRTKQSALQQLASGQAALSPLIDIGERVKGAPSPAFTREGQLREELKLVEGGRLAGELIGSRSAREYALQANASSAEAPESLAMGAGELASDDVLGALGSGLYIGNLWYVNHSDVAAARLTGLTRFATFWVEDGEIQGPVGSMRFDDSLYSFLGEHLLALTRERETIASAQTYGERQTRSMLLPGALTDRFTLTL
jgi:predicted Zn-dependent protease